jgi:8-hydroxy-5-deazaflavin:NADPH oxidoreductase
MQIGILGVGNIGATPHPTAQRRRAPGEGRELPRPGDHPGRPARLQRTGCPRLRGFADVEALILSVPLERIPELRPLVDDLPANAVLLDTSNYYPMRDGNIAALDEGQVESLWVTEQLGGRTVVKAWNAIGARSFITKATTAGSPDRLAIPVAADSDTDRALGISLVQDTGFDGFDAGTLAESWRQQPGAPSYCTNLTSSQLAVALAATVATRSPREVTSP